MHEYTTLYEGTSWLRTTISGTANVLSVTILSGKGNIRFNQELHTSQFNLCCRCRPVVYKTSRLVQHFAISGSTACKQSRQSAVKDAASLSA
eukprot:7802-Heterococcus_DN1.PRE.2